MVLTGGQAELVSRWNEYGGRFGCGSMWTVGCGWLRALAGSLSDADCEKVVVTSSRGWESSLRFLQINTQVSDCARSSSDQRRLY